MQEQMQHSIHRGIQGFSQTEDDHLLSKEKDRQAQLYFKLPQAKPILAKHYIDHSKPKVLIREVRINRECTQLTASLLSCNNLSEKAGTGKRDESRGETTLWRRFMLGNGYRCLYAKYLGKEVELQGKRLRTQILKMSLNRQYLVATYVMDINFLSDGAPSLLRNLEDYSLKQDQLYLQGMSNEYEFDSRFQCGNLMYVFQKTDNDEKSGIKEFYLVLENDINTKGYGNWFYFKFYSKRFGKYRFHLMNCQKKYSFFSCGMRPAVYSLQKHEKQQFWHYDGQSLAYYKNDLLKDEITKMKLNTFSFTYEQTIDNDSIYFAASLPYSYSKLIAYIDNIERTAKANTNLYFKREALASTISCNECPLLTVTWKRDRREQPKGKKKIVLVIARQHPSEVVSSFVAEGLINHLVQLQGGETSSDLLKRYIFKILPMSNIDGVIYGNSRCDITGADPNRKWTKSQNQPMYPVITAVKKLVTGLIAQGYEIEYFIDLHGHSRKLGSFLYSCKYYDQIQSRMFAWIMSCINPRFSYQNCRFGISNFRRETARGYMMNLTANRKAMTLETSFYGWKSNNGVKQFQVNDLHAIGSSLAEAIHIDTFRNSKVINWNTVRNDIKSTIQSKSQIEQQIEETSGSDSNPEIDELTLKEKVQTFLTPNTASKLGLIDIKVVEKSRKQGKQRQPTLEQPYSSHEVFNQDYDTILNKKYLQSQTLIKSDKLVTGLKQSKSATKIRPFRFASLDKKPLSLGKKIRIAIDVQRMQKRQQKLATPSLPSVVRSAKGGHFWENLKKEYDQLVNQKKKLLQSQSLSHGNWTKSK